MQVTLFMAMSLNGLIAREDGKEDFLSDVHWQTFSGLVNKFGCFIVGTKTYQAVKAWPESFGFNDFTNAVRVIVSDDSDFVVDAGYKVAPSPRAALEALQAEGVERALLAGGSTLNSSFLMGGFS